MHRLNIQLLDRPTGTVARFQGDASNVFAGQVADALAPLVRRRVGLVVLDLTDLAFIASTALGELIQFRHDVQDYGGRLRLAGANPRVVDVLKKTRLVELFPLYPDASAALEA